MLLTLSRSTNCYNMYKVLLRFIFLILSSSTTVSAQQVVWQKILPYYGTTRLSTIGNDLILHTTRDSCYLVFPSLMTIDPLTGNVSDSISWGHKYCMSTTQGEWWASVQYGDTLVLAIGVPDSTALDRRLIVRRFPNNIVDTLYDDDVAPEKISTHSTASTLCIDYSRMFLLDNDGNEIGSYSPFATTFQQLVTSPVTNRNYGFSVVNPTTSNNGIIAVCLDATLNLVDSDTIIPGNGTQQVPKAIASKIRPELYLINTNINPGALTVHRMDSLAQFETSVLLGNYRFVGAEVDTNEDYLFVLGTNQPTSRLMLFKIDLNSFSLIDSLEIDTLAAWFKVMMTISPDNNIYIVDKSYSPVVKVKAVNSNLQLFGFVTAPDTAVVYNFTAGIASAVGGKVWACYRGQAETFMFHVDFGALSVNDYTTTCNSSYQITQNEFYSGAQVGCKPIQLQVTDIAGRSVFEEIQPNQFSFTPKATGIYIVTVLFENGDVKREKVFLTAH